MRIKAGQYNTVNIKAGDLRNGDTFCAEFDEVASLYHVVGGTGGRYLSSLKTGVMILLDDDERVFTLEPVRLQVVSQGAATLDGMREYNDD